MVRCKGRRAGAVFFEVVGAEQGGELVLYFTRWWGKGEGAGAVSYEVAEREEEGGWYCLLRGLGE